MKQELILTIGRRIGAGGLAVAKELSARLDAKMYDKELLAEAARSSGLSPEVFIPSDEKPRKRGLAALFSSRGYGPLTESMSHRSVLGDDNLFSLQSEVMHTLAEQHPRTIFVGRCADYILRDCPNLFSVFITAPLEQRTEMLARAWEVSPEAARKRIEQEEKRRADYYNYFTFQKWGDSASYDLCIDAAAVGGNEAVVEVILFALRKRGLID
jgi:cytidylate kinase